MGKLLKGILITVGEVILIVIVLVAVFFGVAANRTKNYLKYATPAGDIEKAYTALGGYEVSTEEYDANNSVYKKHEVWYPSEMKNSDKKYPLVIMANGTGTKASQYKEVFKHLASWGFVVAGNEDENSRTGASQRLRLTMF